MKVWRLTRRSSLALASVLLVLGGGAFALAPAGAAQVVDPTGYLVTIHTGSCPSPNATAAYEIGTTLPWGLGETPDDAITGDGVLHVTTTIDEPLDNFLQQGQPFTVVVTSPDAAAATVACGDIVNLVENGQLAIPLTPIAGSGVAGVALLDNDAQGFLGLGGDEVQVTAYVLAGLGGGGAAIATATTAAVSAASPAAIGTSTATPAVTITARGTDFQPNLIVLPADTPVTVAITNADTVVHNLSVTDQGNAGLENLNISVTVNPGETKTFTVNAPAGDYYFFSGEDGDEAAGLRGYFQVQDGATISSSAATVTPRPE